MNKKDILAKLSTILSIAIFLSPILLCSLSYWFLLLLVPSALMALFVFFNLVWYISSL